MTAEPVEPVPADVRHPAPAPIHTGPARLDEVDEASPLVHPTDGVHTDGVEGLWTHTDDEARITRTGHRP